MKIAVAYDNGLIFEHFGRTEAFKIYEADDGVIKSSQVISTNGSGHGALVGFLKENGVEVLICGGIGMGAQNALAEAGIKLCGNVFGAADIAALACAAGTLAYDENVQCNHHGEHGHHHGEQHGNCGAGGCGRHGCHES